MVNDRNLSDIGAKSFVELYVSLANNETMIIMMIIMMITSILDG